MLRKIKLLGYLGKKFGKEHKMDVQSPAEALRALCSQVRGFKEYLLGSGREKKFKVIVGNAALQDIEKESRLVSEGSDIILAPVVKGGGGGVGQVVLGAALIGLAIWNPAFLSMTSSTALAVGAAGAGIMLGGILGMTMRPPATPSPSERSKDNDRSYLFNGAVNTTQQGQPIPIGYGRMRIGSQVVSASISTTQIPI